MLKSKLTLLISIVSVFLFSSHVMAATHQLESTLLLVTESTKNNYTVVDQNIFYYSYPKVN